MKKLLTFVTAALFCTGVVYAAGESTSPISFDELDANSDNYISKKEAKVLSNLADNMNKYDQNSDQQLDRSEFAQFETEIQQEQQEIPGNGKTYGTW